MIRQRTAEQTEGGEQLDRAIERFDADNAPIVGIIHGNGQMGMTVDAMPDGSGPTRLFKFERHAALAIARPGDAIEARLLDMLATVGLSPDRLGHPDVLEEHKGDLDRIAAKLAAGNHPDLEPGIAALRALSTQLAERIQAARSKGGEGDAIALINGFLAEQETPFYVSVLQEKHATPHDAVQEDGRSFAYAHHLAPLERVEETDEGYARFILRGSDDQLGYRDGSVELYR